MELAVSVAAQTKWHLALANVAVSLESLVVVHLYLHVRQEQVLVHAAGLFVVVVREGPLVPAAEAGLEGGLGEVTVVTFGDFLQLRNVIAQHMHCRLRNVE